MSGTMHPDDALASRFYAQRPQGGWLSRKQTNWLIALWCKHPANWMIPATLAAGGTLYTAEGAPIGRWELLQHPGHWNGTMRYIVETVEGSSDPC